MRSLIELETFISVGERADEMAKVGVSDYDSDAYKTAFVAHFKSLLRSKPYDFSTDFLDDLSKDLNSSLEEDPNIAIGPFFEFGYIKKFLKFLPDELEHALKLEKRSHGGARPNSGRKKAAPTKQIRVDSDLAEQCKMLSDLYRGQSDADKAHLLEMLVSVGVSFCQEKAAKHALDDI